MGLVFSRLFHLQILHFMLNSFLSSTFKNVTVTTSKPMQARAKLFTYYLKKEEEKKQ
jgi:hypothetical protein